MSAVREELIEYGVKIAQAGLVAGAGGNISARDGNLIWMKPSGFAMDEMAPADLCGMDLAGGRQVQGAHKPTSEVNMHLAIYRVRPEVTAIFHTHSPWAAGVISAGLELKTMFAEFSNDLGRVATIPYITPTTMSLADAMGAQARDHDTLLMVNHGVLAVGTTMKQAYCRCLVAEDAAKSMVAAAMAGKPQIRISRQIADLLANAGSKRRIKMTGKGK